MGVPYNQVRLNRQTAGKWPAEHRIAGVSFEIHRILEKLDDRFDRSQNPPRHPRDGVPRWTQDAAKRQVGWRVDNPQTPQEKVEAIHDLAVDDQVAARVATDFLRRPSVAFLPLSIHASEPIATSLIQCCQVSLQVNGLKRCKASQACTSGLRSADTVEALIVHGGYRGGVAVALTDPTGWGDLSRAMARGGCRTGRGPTPRDGSISPAPRSPRSHSRSRGRVWSWPGSGPGCVR
ncbi:DUF6192 family protein [Streptomyces massasporeus]|uniref:DUF6192 family protein n=1 Tax=Streptomyces massasporeus TaxID=67324 RepID=UPI003693AB63